MVQGFYCLSLIFESLHGFQDVALGFDCILLVKFNLIDKIFRFSMNFGDLLRKHLPKFLHVLSHAGNSLIQSGIEILQILLQNILKHNYILLIALVPFK